MKTLTICGTNPEALIEEQERVADAASRLLEALGAATPHPRDYLVDVPSADAMGGYASQYAPAFAAHLRACSAVLDILTAAQAERESIQRQLDERAKHAPVSVPCRCGKPKLRGALYCPACAQALAAARDPQKPAPERDLVPCGTFGCTRLKHRDDVFCPTCAKDAADDPDAYK